MKARLGFILVGFAILILGIAWYTLRGRNQDFAQIFPATINRDCAPWDGAAFTVQIPMNDEGIIAVSIWQAPDIKFPKTFSFPDSTAQIGNTVLRHGAASPEQLSGKVTFYRVTQESAVEGKFELHTETGRQFRGNFIAEWGKEIVMCG